MTFVFEQGISKLTQKLLFDKSTWKNTRRTNFRYRCDGNEIVKFVERTSELHRANHCFRFRTSSSLYLEPNTLLLSIVSQCDESSLGFVMKITDFLGVLKPRP
jgi:hypothetical protein